MTIAHQSPYDVIPGLSQKQLNTTVWGGGGVTTTIVDPTIHANSALLVYSTSTPPAGDWALNVTNGQVVITSSAAESAVLAIAYIVL